MNNKTAKLLRRWSRTSGESESLVKTLWKDTPRNERYKVRNNILKELATQTKPEIVKTDDGKTLALHN